MTAGKLKDRYVFPVFDKMDRLIGAAGRDLNNSSPIKWKLIGEKSFWVYPFKYNNEYIKKEKSVFLVESIGDMLALWEAGIKYTLVLFGLTVSSKIKQILIGTNNTGKYKEISALFHKEVKKYSLKEFKIASPEETGKNFKENSLIKASYFSRKTNLICLADDSGLEIELLNGAPGIYSSRWSGKNKDFDIAIKKVFYEMSKIKKDWINNHNKANFVCCLTLFWPSGENFSGQ